MIYNKISETYKIKDFCEQIKEAHYSDYFTTKEIDIYGRRRKKGGLAARYLLKKIVIEKLSIPIQYKQLEITNNLKGKPQLQFLTSKTDFPSHIHFSISHSATQVAVLVIIN